MTGYYISIGYNPCNTDYDSMWETLKKEARRVCDDPRAIENEARRLGAPEECEEGCCDLTGYADVYALPFGSPGHPVVIEVGEGEEERFIAQMASTDAGFKYHVRRAFVRLLIEAMHRQEIEVSLSVG